LLAVIFFRFELSLFNPLPIQKIIFAALKNGMK